jgi:hypothetical protein
LLLTWVRTHPAYVRREKRGSDEGPSDNARTQDACGRREKRSSDEGPSDNARTQDACVPRNYDFEASEKQ